jgi:hypothetical protein
MFFWVSSKEVARQPIFVFNHVTFSVVLLPVNSLVVYLTKMAAVVQGPALDLSEYTNNLDTISRSQYLQKVSMCGGIDPYALKKKDCGTDLELYPAVVSRHLQLPGPVDILLHHETDESMEEYERLQLLCVWLGERPWREKAARQVLHRLCPCNYDICDAVSAMFVV